MKKGEFNAHCFDSPYPRHKRHRFHHYRCWMRRCLQPCYRPFVSLRNFQQTLLGFLPILQWLPSYKWQECLLADMTGGFTAGVMNVPQGIAYALLAKVDPVVGLYNSLFPALFYMVFGTSRHTSIGSFAVVALMTGEAVEEIQVSLNATLTLDPIVIASTLCFGVGIVQLLMGLFHLHILTAYLSDQLVAGFTTAVCLHVAAAQLKDLFGLKSELPLRQGLGQLPLRLSDIVMRLPTEANPATLCVSAASLGVLIVGNFWVKPYICRRICCSVPLPVELSVMCISTLLAALFAPLQLFYEVAILGELPLGLPQPMLPEWSLLPKLIPNAVGIAVVSVAIHISLAKMFAKEFGYRIDSAQELYALGIASAGSSFFRVHPVSCSLSRTMVNVEAGTKTQFSTVFFSLILLSIILYLGRWLRTMPMCVLSAIIIVAALPMLKRLRDLRDLWPVSKIDFSIWLVSFTSTVGWGVIEGLAVSVLYALFTIVLRTQFPSWQRVGQSDVEKMANGNECHERKENSPSGGMIDERGICIFCFNSPLLFTNVDRFEAAIDEVMGKWEAELKWAEAKSSTISTLSATAAGSQFLRHFIIDCSGISYVDSMGVCVLKETLLDVMERRRALIYLAALNSRVADFLESSDICVSLPKACFYPTLRDAYTKARERMDGVR